MTPKITVITVVYNGRDTIDDSLNSVARQGYKNIEHIIVDGGSTDDTMQIVHRYSNKLAKVVSEPDQGVYDAMNKGLGLAKGDIVGFLNADDLYVSDTAINRVVEVFKDPGVDACYSDLVYVDRMEISKVRRYWKSREFRPGLFSKGWMPPHPTFFARKKVYEEFGGFDTQYRFASDFEIMMRFLEVARINSVYIPEVMVRMRAGGMTNSHIRGVILANLESYRACKKNGIEVSFFFPIRKVLSRLPQYLKKKAARLVC